MENSKKAVHSSIISSNSPGPDPLTNSPSPTVDSPTDQIQSANSPIDPASPSSADMALVAHNNPGSLLTTTGGINKRYRPAPAKTFQCRGYGECRMVFSRSEHLARHIRKHTGERPFTCHCGKQFSRLDNLRQHAQTVHADKQEQNEQMMRDLTSLHATMAAASKVGAPRGKRGQAATSSSNATSSGSQENGVKQEEMGDSFRGRPGTSTGYEGDHNIYQGTTWHVQSSDMDRANSRPTNNHSFRDPSQSFLASPSSTSQSQSFLGFSANTFNFVSDFARDGRPGSSSSSRPNTAGGPDALARTLPPLAAVVSAALPTSSSNSFSIASQSTQHVLPLSGSTGFRRPSTATRPGTAPASYFTSKSNFGSGMANRTELSVPGYARTGELAAAAASPSYSYDAEPTSPSGPSYESPFSFHPPSITDAQPANGGALASSTSSTSSVNPRKRPYPGSDGDDGSRRESGGNPPEYDYGSESRPQSRRLTVMELCNDTDANSGSRAVLSGAGSRPTTSSGLTASASALALVDRASLSSPPLRAAAAAPAAGADALAAGGTSPAFGGGGVSPEFRRSVPSSAATAAATAAVFSAFRGTFTSPPLSDASSSPRSAAASFAAAHRSGIHSKPPSPDAAGALSRRGGGGESHHDQVRVAVGSPHSPTALGMRV